MSAEYFGRMPGGETVRLIKLENAAGMSVEVISLGATIHRITVPGRDGSPADVVLGKPDVAGYLAAGAPAAAVIGRVANRIKGASFELGGAEYHLDVNERGNTLHSGGGNYALRNFEVIGEDGCSVRLALRDGGEGGFPGGADVEVCYTIGDDGALEALYRISPDADTPVNLTNHAYFNLGGHASGPVYGHEIQIDADFHTPADAEDIPTGEVRSVDLTPFDLRRGCVLGEAMRQLEQAGDRHNGFDHNFVVNGSGMRRAAGIYEPLSGRAMDVYTDLPGMQLYVGNFIPAGTIGKDGAVYAAHHGLCLETQFFPDSVHRPHFPSSLVGAGGLGEARTVFKFGLR